MSAPHVRIHHVRDFAPVVRSRCLRCGRPAPAHVPACICGAILRATRTQEGGDPLARPPGATRLLHLSDLHLEGEAHQPHRGPTLRHVQFQQWLQWARGADVEGVVVSGDLADVAGDAAAFRWVAEELKGSGLRSFVVPGNHDVWGTGVGGRHLLAPFGEVFGTWPRLERLGPVELLLIDSNPPMARSTTEQLGTASSYVPFTEGALGEAQRAEVEALPAPVGEPPLHRVLVLHHHLVRHSPEAVTAWLPTWLVDDETTFAGRLDTMQPLHDAEAAIAWATARGIGLALHGHKHIPLRPGVLEGGLCVVSCGSSTGSRALAQLLDLMPDGTRRVRGLSLVNPPG